MGVMLRMRLAGLVLAIGLMATPALALGLDPAFPEPALGPGQAKGVAVWSHGRSLNNCSPRLLASSSGVNGGNCNVL